MNYLMNLSLSIKACLKLRCGRRRYNTFTYETSIKKQEQNMISMKICQWPMNIQFCCIQSFDSVNSVNHIIPIDDIIIVLTGIHFRMYIY